jgi:hypothetical protein
MKLKVTVPPGTFDIVVVSVTVAVTVVVQLVEPEDMLQLTLPTLFDVASFTRVTVLDVFVLPLCVESPA